DRVDRPAGGIQVRELLVVITDRDVVPGLYGPGERSEPAREGLQERRLPRPVLAEDGQAFSPQQLEGDVADDGRARLVPGVEVPRPEKASPADPCGVELESHRGRVLEGLLDSLDAGEPRAASLG